MVVRRYVVKQMPEAVLLMRRDLGRDAVILSTRSIFLKRWLGLWRTRRIEVLAAAGDDVPVQTQVPQTAKRSSAPQQRVGVPVQGGGGTADAHAALDASVAQALSGPQAGIDGASSGAVQPADARSGTAVGVSKGAPPALVSAPVSVSVDETTEVRQSVQAELASIRQLLSTAILSPRGTSTSLLQRLLAEGVEESLALEVLAEVHRADSGDAGGVSGDGGAAKGRLEQRLASYLLSRLGSACAAQPIRPDARIAAFVGPTGVGKTTTVAKLAAQHVLSGERRVGVVTTDTFRIAAIDQLRTYANILQVPLETVYEPGDLAGALERLADRDLILIDTAGRNFQNPAHVDEMQALLSGTAVDETFLVLSLTTKASDLNQIADAFSNAVDKLLLTKMDETLSYGSALNLLLRHPMPLSYVTTGQNVPDDIETASLEKLVNSVVGADSHA